MNEYEEIRKVAHGLYERSGRVVMEGRKDLSARNDSLSDDKKEGLQKNAKQRPVKKITAKKQSGEPAEESCGKISRRTTSGRQVPKSRTPGNGSTLKKNG
jgi:hypothetical protein